MMLSGWTSSENLSVADGKHFAGDELRALDAGGLSLFDNNQSGITIKGGKVGVHQAAPVYDLDVDGSGNFTSLYVGGNSVLTGEGSVFGKWEDGTTAGEIFYTGGNVGVGTINPEHNFHVVGDGVIDGNFIVNGTSGTFNVGEFDVSGSNITLNSAGGGLDSSRGGLIVNGDNGTGKLEYLDSTQTWQSNQDIQIVADKHLQTDKVRAIDSGGLYLQDDDDNGIHIQDGGQVNIAGLTKANGGLNVGNGKFDIQSDGTLGSVPPNTDDVIKWNGTKWVADVSPGGGGGGGSSEVPSAIIDSLIAGESIQEITYGPYDSTPRIATDLEIVGDGSVIPYALSGVSETGYFAVFSQEIPNNNYKIHTVFGGKDVYWETGSSSSIYYNDGDVSLQRNLTVGGNLTVAGNTTTLNTQTLEIEDHNIVIASNTGYNQLTDVYPVGGDYAGVFWGTGDAGAASPVSLTYQSNKGFAFEGGNVGIGTTNPGAKLHLNQENANGYANLLCTTTTESFSMGVGGTSAPQGSLQDKFYIYDNAITTGGPRLIINSAGHVGIGTTSPNISQSASGSTVLTVSASETSRVGVLELKGTRSGIGDPVGYLRTFNNADNSPITDIQSIRGADSNEGGGPYGKLLFRTSGEDAMLIDTAGNVGIGTTNPGAKLEILDSYQGYDSSTTPNRSLDIRTGSPQNSYSSIGLESRSPNNTDSAISTITCVPVGDGSGALAFGTRHEYNTGEKMRIDSSGNVGIGTTNPGGKLQVNDFQLISGFTVQTILGGITVYTDADMQSVLSNGDSVRISGIVYTIKNLTEATFQLNTPATYENSGLPIYLYKESLTIKDGNVGIGTTSPGALLHTYAADANAYNIFEGSVGKWVFAQVNNYCQVGGLYGTHQGVVIDSAGYVGIGTTDPGSYKLNVNGISNFSGNSNWTSGTHLYWNGGDVGITNSGKNLLFKAYGSDSLLERVRIDSSGNVGIGTTSPDYKLDIST